MRHTVSVWKSHGWKYPGSGRASGTWEPQSKTGEKAQAQNPGWEDAGALPLTAISLSANDKEQSSLVLKEKDNLQMLECIQLSVFSYSVCVCLMFKLVDSP